MKTVLHQANTRHSANHGWLKVNHTFSFADYYDPSRMNFGLLRVLNDDIIDPHTGFGEHPHDNMEIVTIPLAGTLSHKDNHGGSGVIRTGDIQVMSAGSGIRHSETNNHDVAANVLQTWVFPKEKQIAPRYEQKSFDWKNQENHLRLVVSPDGRENSLSVNQNVFYSLGQFTAGKAQTYQIRQAQNGLYIFIIEGHCTVENQPLQTRDGLGLWDISKVNFSFKEKTQLLLIDVPMN